MNIYDIDLKQDDWHTCFAETQDIYLDTEGWWVGRFEQDETFNPYIIYQWKDWVKMIRNCSADWGDGLLLASSLTCFTTMGQDEMEVWLEYFASRYIRAGKMNDVMAPRDQVEYHNAQRSGDGCSGRPCCGT